MMNKEFDKISIPWIHADRIPDCLFSGAGSTYIACKSLNRIPTAIEIDGDYVDITRKRLENL